MFKRWRKRRGQPAPGQSYDSKAWDETTNRNDFVVELRPIQQGKIVFVF
jgi:hypothetical protein